MKYVFIYLNILTLSLLAACSAPSVKVEYPDRPASSNKCEVFEKYNTGPLKLSEAVRELTQGITDPYFDSNFILKLVNAEETQKTGEYVEYWDNGQLKMKGAFKNGLADGHVHGWYEDGFDAFKGYYRDGIKLGIHMSFVPPEIKRSRQGDALILIYDDEGKLHGEQISSFRDGRLQNHGCYKNGKLDGTFTVYGEDRKVILMHEYESGRFVSESDVDEYNAHHHYPR